MVSSKPIKISKKRLSPYEESITYLKQKSKEIECNNNRPLKYMKDSSKMLFCNTKPNLEILTSNNSLNIENNMEIIPHVPNDDEKSLLYSSFQKNFVTQNMEEDLYKIITDELIYFKLRKDVELYTQGDEGSCLYILVSGNVVSISNKKKEGQNEKIEKTLKNWDIFGELALLKTCEREESIICKSESYFYVLECEHFRDIQMKINNEDLKERYSFINEIPLFVTLDSIYKFNLSSKIQLKYYAPGTVIIHKDSVGDTLYIIKKGSVSCKINDNEIRKLYEKEYFGQNSIIMDTKRGCDVISLDSCICYEITTNSLKEALSENYTDIILYSYYCDCIKKNKFFNEFLLESKYYELFQTFSISTYKSKEYIYEPNQVKSKNRRILIILEGSLYKSVKLSNGSDELNKDAVPKDIYAKRGDILGENIFHNKDHTLPKDVFAYPDCITLETYYEDLQKIMGFTTVIKEKSNFCSSCLIEDELNDHENIINIQKIKQLKKVNIFKHLSDSTINQIVQFMKERNYNKKDYIVKEGEIGDSLFLIIKGQVKITVNSKMIRYLDEGSCFGEVALLNEGEKRTASVICTSNEVLCYEIKKSDFKEIITDKAIIEYLKYQIALQDTSVELEDLYNVKFLGKGKFGHVNLVHNKKNIYAVKTVSRKAVEYQKMLVKYYVSERRIMLLLDHPFIVKLVKTMKNSNFCFFLMEYINGINLDDYLSSKLHKTKNINESKFYVASLILVLEYLSKKGIAHRDIKPSNIMITSNGYLKVIDFGTAKILTDYTNTVIGTPFYIAPEILKGKGYTFSCDFWSLGICLYEMFYGEYPFGAYATEVKEIYKDILRKDYAVSKRPEFCDINGLISDLLQKKPNIRLCNTNFLKKRPFFLDYDWDALIDFQIKPPYIPNSLKITDQFSSTISFESSLNENDFSLDSKSYKIPKDYNKNWAEEF